MNNNNNESNYCFVESKFCRSTQKRAFKQVFQGVETFISLQCPHFDFFLLIIGDIENGDYGANILE